MYSVFRGALVLNRLLKELSTYLLILFYLICGEWFCVLRLVRIHRHLDQRRAVGRRQYAWDIVVCCRYDSCHSEGFSVCQLISCSLFTVERIWTVAFYRAATSPAPQRANVIKTASSVDVNGNLNLDVRTEQISYHCYNLVSALNNKLYFLPSTCT